MDPMSTIVPSIDSRAMILATPWLRSPGALTLTASMASHSSGVVSQTVPRSVMAAQLTKLWQAPKLPSSTARTCSQAPVWPRSAARNSARHCSVRSDSAAAWPLAPSRPTSSRPDAPSETSRCATA